MRDGLESKEPPYSWVIDVDHLLTVAKASGASGFGVTTARPFVESRRKLIADKKAGRSGPLHFTYGDPVTATDVTASFPWARSIVVFSHDYIRHSSPPPSTGAVVARFAGSDRYQPLRSIAGALSVVLEAHGHKAETLIDDNRLVDRAAAARSGVGWIGKSTMVLAPGHGPWLLLGSVVTDADLEPTEPMTRDCGTCVACIPACPTAAITEGGLDASRCISTWLQAPGSIPLWIRPHIGRRIYGCDDCLTSCPPGHRSLEVAQGEAAESRFEDLLSHSDDELVGRFPWWYVPRRDGRYIRRNLLIAAGNSGEAAAVPVITEHLRHPSSLIRGHAAWALARSIGQVARDPLEEALAAETVREPREELSHALAMIGEAE